MGSACAFGANDGNSVIGRACAGWDLIRSPVVYSDAADRAFIVADSAERVAAQVARILSPSAVGVSGSAV